MKMTLCLLAGLMLAPAFSNCLWAQKSIVKGTVINGITNEKISGVSVMVKNRNEGAYSDDQGNVRLMTGANFPLILVVSSIGFETREITIDQQLDVLNIQLIPSIQVINPITYSVTRTPIRLRESPVSLERLSAANIRNAATPGFYESIVNLKGVDLTTSGLHFRTVSTRGFNNSGNLRVNQFMDGMDNQAPGLNFAIGNLLGVSELDVESVELLPGASSALYGSGGVNGTLMINSKNPFDYQGFSFQLKEGVMHVDEAQHKPSPYHDFAFRWAKAVGKLAFKMNVQFIQAKDWQAGDEANLQRTNVVSKQKAGNRQSDPNYDGVNVYGDEVNADMFSTTQAILYQALGGFRSEFQQRFGRDPSQNETDRFMSDHPDYKIFWMGMKTGIIPKQRVSRTGYKERELVDYNSYNLKVSSALHYKISDQIEASLVAYWGTGTTVYTGADRYYLKGVKMGQYKIELRHKNWFLRGFTTQENAGNAYNTTALASYINESWKPSQKWFPEYIANYTGAVLGGLSNDDAHLFARDKADMGRLLPGTEAFNKQHESIRKTPISRAGAMFLDKSDLWQYDAQLNLSDKIKVVDLLIGGNFKQYVLNSEGTIFADRTGRIRVPEWGGFMQVQKALFNEFLKITASGRYDKSKNFDGQFTPRITGLLKVGGRDYIRMSYQSAYRFPAMQDQYIDLFTGTTTLIGALPRFATQYDFEGNPVYTAQSIAAYRETKNVSDLKKAAFNKLRPEKVKSVELGYKGYLMNSFLIDVYSYYSQYNNFIGRSAVGQPQSALSFEGDLLSSFTTKSFAYAQNMDQKVDAYGFGIGLEYRTKRNYIAGLNISSDKIYGIPGDFISFFNTPGYRFNISVSNEQAWRLFGFNVQYRWQDEMDWEGTFGSGRVPAYGTVDAQISYKLRGTKSMIKLGASNLLNKYYYSAFGNPAIGGLYFLSFGYNIINNKQAE